MDSIWYHVNWPTSSTESLSRTFSMKSCVSSPMLSEFEARRSVNLFECSEYRSSIDLRALLNPCNSYPFVTAFSYCKNIKLVSETMVYRQNKRPCNLWVSSRWGTYIRGAWSEYLPFCWVWTWLTDDCSQSEPHASTCPPPVTVSVSANEF